MPAGSVHRARIGLAVPRTLPAGATLWDTEIKGFGVRRQSTTASHFLKTRIKGRQRWITIGKHGSPWTPEMARGEALRLLAEAHAGRMPERPQRRAPDIVTMVIVVSRYRSEHMSKLKPRSRRLYEQILERSILP